MTQAHTCTSEQSGAASQGIIFRMPQMRKQSHLTYSFYLTAKLLAYLGIQKPENEFP